MDNSTIWRMAHETDVFPYYFQRTDLPIPRMSGFIKELWDSLSNSHGKTIIIDSCMDGSTNQNEIGLIGKECLSLMEEGSVVTLMEGSFIDRSKLTKFKYHSLPIFIAQVQFYEVVEYTTDTTLSVNCFLLFGIPQLIAIVISMLTFRIVRRKNVVSPSPKLRSVFGVNMAVLLVGITLASWIYFGAFRGNTVVQTYTSTIGISLQLDFLIGQGNREKKLYATSTGRIPLLESICDDDRHIAAIYPMEVIEAFNQNKIQCTLRQ
ncbi:hypothetical protein PFISCL1PPCAC_19721 [Pristionchus fissidentatus]|uniref:G protein-coupled receptor n=1 Tax=Pristionchus fissidentatus TaxID=1538716 RepID=A0AAV5WCG3_9BILA|nr:hypothetical protein PFISCL1PPCAC_19721 [Pristionchus fissidentatus]